MWWVLVVLLSYVALFILLDSPIFIVHSCHIVCIFIFVFVFVAVVVVVVESHCSCYYYDFLR